MMPKWLAIVLILASTALVEAAGGEVKSSGPAAPVPKPELSPSQVVEIQLEALQYVDRPTKGAGIATTFQFASPGNREITGPLERFALLFQGPAFQPLIKHRIAGYGLFVQKGDVALRRVTVVAADGKAYEYEFRLSKDPATRCWFTEGVIPLVEKPAIDPGKVARTSQNSSSPPLESLLHLSPAVLRSTPG